LKGEDEGEGEKLDYPLILAFSREGRRNELKVE
jgi:hypothetical protein